MNTLIGVLSTLLVLSANGQVQKDTLSIGWKDLVGVWQRNYKEAGNGLLQNFRFFSDSTFEVHFTDPGEDVRTIRQLKGSYRLDKKLLYLTIKSRVVYEGGEIYIIESIEDANIFELANGTLKEIKEPNPKESKVPILITVISKAKVTFDNETYYKMRKEDLMHEGITGKF